MTLIQLEQQRALEAARDILTIIKARLDLEATTNEAFPCAAFRPEIDRALDKVRLALINPRAA